VVRQGNGETQVQRAVDCRVQGRLLVRGADVDPRQPLPHEGAVGVDHPEHHLRELVDAQPRAQRGAVIRVHGHRHEGRLAGLEVLERVQRVPEPVLELALQLGYVREEAAADGDIRGRRSKEAGQLIAAGRRARRMGRAQRNSSFHPHRTNVL
jgi:hypothetical protein